MDYKYYLAQEGSVAEKIRKYNGKELLAEEQNLCLPNQGRFNSV